MAEHEDGQERTEQATPRRLQKARDQGQIARSRELNTMGVLLGGAASLFVLGPGLISGLAGLSRHLFSLERETLLDSAGVVLVFRDALVQAVTLLAPLFVVVTALAIIAPLALGGWAFSSSALAFKLEKLDPIKGLKRVFSLRGLMELVKALAKFLLVAGVAVAMLRHDLKAFLALGQEGVRPALADATWLLAHSFLILSAALVLIAAVDVPFQLWDHARQLRMSRQEVRDELKETEGKPEVKSRIRSLQREVAQRRMMEEVPQADVIVTNPTHFAVALRYAPERMDAPRIVAKGRERIAQRIREVGEASGVPVLTLPPLARALYRDSEIGDEVPAALYVAVAQVLAYVFQLRTYRSHGGEVPRPPRPQDLGVPEESEEL